MNDHTPFDSILISEAGFRYPFKFPNGQSLNCLICEYSFATAERLAVHYVAIHDLKNCAMCQTLFATEDDLRAHLHKAHTCEICSICHNDFSDQHQLNTHLVDEHSMKRCEFCSSFCVAINEYKDHLCNGHKILSNTPKRGLFVKLREDFFCRLCAFRYALKDFLEHYLHYHTISLSALLDQLNERDNKSLTLNEYGEKTACTVCNQKYMANVPTIMHKIYCERYMFCQCCTKLFQNRNEFHDHMENNAMCEQKDICDNGRCTFCDKTIEITNLKNHRLEYHKMNENSNETANSLFDMKNMPKKSNKRISTCNLCQLNPTETITNITELIEHYINYHRFTKPCVLVLLRQSNKQLDNNMQIDFSPGNTNPEGVYDFDTRMVKFVYSSIEDLTSDEGGPSTKYSFACLICSHKAVSKSALIGHMNKVHGFTTNPVEFWCGICQKNYRSLRSLRLHNTNKHSPIGEFFQCSFCSFESRRKTDVRNHITQHNEVTYHPCTSRSIGFNCRYCKYTSWTRNQLNDHIMNMHTGPVAKNYVLCLVCATSLSSLVALRAHMKNEHPHENFSGQFLFQCEICKINFADVEDIRKHMVKVHPDCQTLFCSVSGCGHMVNNNEALIDHVRKKHTRSNKDC